MDRCTCAQCRALAGSYNWRRSAGMGTPTKADLEIMNKKLQSDLDDMRAQFRALQDQLKAIGSAASSAAPSQVVPAVSGSSSAAPLLGATALRKEPKKDDVLQTAPSSFAELMKWVSRAGHQIRFYQVGRDMRGELVLVHRTRRSASIARAVNWHCEGPLRCFAPNECK